MYKTLLSNRELFRRTDIYTTQITWYFLNLDKNIFSYMQKNLNILVFYVQLQRLWILNAKPISKYFYCYDKYRLNSYFKHIKTSNIFIMMHMVSNVDSNNQKVLVLKMKLFFEISFVCWKLTVAFLFRILCISARMARRDVRRTLITGPHQEKAPEDVVKDARQERGWNIIA